MMESLRLERPENFLVHLQDARMPPKKEQPRTKHGVDLVRARLEFLALVPRKPIDLPSL
jgi:hypothetical protein